MSAHDLNSTEAEELLNRLSTAWSDCDAAAAADCFTSEAVYMEPPDRQLFTGRDQLTAYFSPLEPGTYLDVQEFWFDKRSQTGAMEFTFGTIGADSADHGVVVLAFRQRKISSWREYLPKGPSAFSEFTSVEGKPWEWHIGNYP